MKKVKNVIRGYLSREYLKDLTIIDNESRKVQYSGDINEYLEVNENSHEILYQEKTRLVNLGVVDSQLFGMKLFLFTKEV